jgi:hypothetical protein
MGHGTWDMVHGHGHEHGNVDKGMDMEMLTWA